MLNAPGTKLLAALRLVIYDVSWSVFQCYFQMGESTALQCVSKMSRGIFNNQTIWEKYLLSITKSNAQRVEKMHFAKHGVNGILGSLDICKCVGRVAPTSNAVNM